MVAKNILRSAQQLNTLIGLTSNVIQENDKSANLNLVHGPFTQNSEPQLPSVPFILTQNWIYTSSYHMVDQKILIEQVGPLDSFTIHGLWKNEEGVEVVSRKETSLEGRISSVLQSPRFNPLREAFQISGIDLLRKMKMHWKARGADEKLWEHEYFAHGKFLEASESSNLDKQLSGFSGIKIAKNQDQAIYDYFRVADDLSQGLDTIKMLAKRGIMPTLTQTYTLSDIQTALTDGFHSLGVYIHCDKNNALDQVRYLHNLKGSFSDGFFEPSNTSFGNSTNCVPNQIKFLPKGYTAQGRHFELEGFIRAKCINGSSGVIISSGSILLGGEESNAATFWLTEVFQGNFYLRSRHGICNLDIDGELICNSHQDSINLFQLDGRGNIGYGGTYTWSIAPSKEYIFSVYAGESQVGSDSIFLLFEDLKLLSHT
ncbi:hypothetical protein BZL39_N00610 [Zygosaccharomyces parabailii]|nr:hypothetical protein BZL39_N00610 [Zygosaccharomyces parabailii]CDH11163.1 uncharacterized protein ZBAI_02949 [Zygosaccharomyces bailii ISA1307]